MDGYSLAILFVVTGLVLSLNPMTLSVFSALLAGALGKNHHKNVIHVIGLAFLLAYSSFLILFSILLIRLLSIISIDLTASLGIAIAVASIIFGLVNIKDYFWYKPKIKIPNNMDAAIHHRTIKKNNPISATMLGMITGFGSIITTGIALLCLAIILTLVQQASPTLIIVPTLCLVLPLIIIFVATLSGTKLSAIIKWKQDSKPLMQLGTGIVYIILGWILLLVLNGSINSIL